jgi:hypothetical protein
MSVRFMAAHHGDTCHCRLLPAPWPAVVAVAALLLAVPAGIAAAAPADGLTEPEPSAPDDSRLDTLLGNLASDDGAVRKSAFDALVETGTAALPKLRAALAATDDADLRWQLSQVIARIEGDRSGDSAPRDPQPDDPATGRSSVFTVTGADGVTYRMEIRGDGSVAAAIIQADGTRDDREFASRADFSERWPDVAGRFAGFGPAARDDDDELTEEGQRYAGMAEAFGRELARRRSMLQAFARLLLGPDATDAQVEDVLRRLSRMPESLPVPPAEADSPGPDADSPIEPQLDPATPLSADEEAELEELRRRRPDPGSPAYREWLSAWRQALQRIRESAPPDRPENGSRPGADGTDDEAAAPLPPGGAERDEQVVVNELGGAAVHAQTGGVALGPLRRRVRAQLGLPPGQGLVVVDVAREGDLADAGVQRFDVLLAINGRPVTDARSVIEALDTVPAGSDFVVDALRRAQPVTLVAERNVGGDGTAG